jgi:stringent starvation protein B
VSLTSTKPYLLRAIYEWCADQGLTPYIAVVVNEHTIVPRQYVKDGQIVLNVGAEAAHQLHMGNDFITLTARFGGVAQNLSVPVDQVAAIYAKENGHGMAFEVAAAAAASEAQSEAGAEPPTQPDAAPESSPPEPPPEPDKPAGTRPYLVRIK